MTPPTAHLPLRLFPRLQEKIMLSNVVRFIRTLTCETRRLVDFAAFIFVIIGLLVVVVVVSGNVFFVSARVPLTVDRAAERYIENSPGSSKKNLTANGSPRTASRAPPCERTGTST